MEKKLQLVESKKSYKAFVYNYIECKQILKEFKITNLQSSDIISRQVHIFQAKQFP